MLGSRLYLASISLSSSTSSLSFSVSPDSNSLRTMTEWASTMQMNLLTFHFLFSLDFLRLFHKSWLIVRDSFFSKTMALACQNQFIAFCLWSCCDWLNWFQKYSIKWLWLKLKPNRRYLARACICSTALRPSDGCVYLHVCSPCSANV